MIVEVSRFNFNFFFFSAKNQSGCAVDKLDRGELIGDMSTLTAEVWTRPSVVDHHCVLI